MQAAPKSFQIDVMICGFLSVVVRHRDVSAVRVEFGLFSQLW